MRVTVICDVLGEANNGTTLAALNLIRYLREKGHTVTVVAPGKQTDIAHIEVPILNLGSFCNAILRNYGVCLAKVDKNILDQAIRGASSAAAVSIVVGSIENRTEIWYSMYRELPLSGGKHHCAHRTHEQPSCVALDLQGFLPQGVSLLCRCPLSDRFHSSSV